MVYWITGLSKSGKTLIGTTLYYELKKRGVNTIILDGDIMKHIASDGSNIAYDDKSRLVRGRRYSLLAKMLSDQGVTVIVCTKAMFDEVRAWNRSNISDYIEIFIDASYEILMKRGGIDLNNDHVEYPKCPDLRIENDGRNSISAIINQILQIAPNNKSDYDRDRDYWNNYYKKIFSKSFEPSSFARYINSMLKPNSSIIELGCGNGRDSLFFLDKGHSVIAVDESNIAIEMLNDKTSDNARALFVCDDFVRCSSLYQMKYDCIYSRFTLHAIKEYQEDELLDNMAGALEKDGIVCIEARTVNDDLFGKGEKVGENEFIYNKHYRRFIDAKSFNNKMQKLGYSIISFEERRGFSKTEESDPVLMRCIAGIEK